MRAIESTLKVSKPAFESTFNLSVKKTSEILAKHVATSALKIERNCGDYVATNICRGLQARDPVSNREVSHVQETQLVHC